MMTFIVALIVIGIFILLFFLFGIIHTKKGYVSIIEKNHEFYKIEMRKFSFYTPVVFHKVKMYPIEPKKYKVDNKTYLVKIIDYVVLYKSKKDIKTILLTEKELCEQYGIRILEIID